jgi:galactokinase
VIEPEALAREFEAAVGRSPRLYRAPGRVNLIGEHTDYNDGFVMPIALDRDTWVAAAPRDDRTLVVRSKDFNETVSIDLEAGISPDVVAQPFLPPLASDRSERRRDSPKRERREGGRAACAANGAPEGLRYESTPTSVAPVSEACRWSRYILGVARTLDCVGGADLMIASDVPIGAGLSSSAALEVACGFALLDLAGASIDLDHLAHAAQRAEHDFAGTRCGIMDQTIACHGRADAALWLDTRSLERRWLPLPPHVRVVVGNTMVRHELASGEYNARRADCEAAVAALARLRPSVRALRDATLADLDAVSDRLSERVSRRCRHVITENARVGQAAEALENHDVHRVGTLMNESHDSLRRDYEVSCTELDTMVAIARSLAGVHGARMTGGGFGGCVVALVDRAAATNVVREIARKYKSATGMTPDVWPTGAGAGVGGWPVGASA